MKATQPSVAFTTITGKASVLFPSPLRSAAGTLPSGSSRSTPAYHVSALVRRPIRPAPASFRPPTDTVPSPAGTTGVSATAPSDEKSRSSTILGAPVLVVIRPFTPGSMPVSRIAISTPRPSYVGSRVGIWSPPVLCRGRSPAMRATAGGSAGSFPRGAGVAAVALASAGADGPPGAGAGLGLGVVAGRGDAPPHAASTIARGKRQAVFMRSSGGQRPRRGDR